MRASRSTVSAAAVATALAGLSLSAPATAQLGPMDLERLQSCLDRAGFGQREWSANELRQNTASCLRGAFASPACPAPHFSRGLSVALTIGEPHPTWSSNDRARLADQLPRWIDDVVQQHPRIHGSAHSRSVEPLSLDVQLRYAGSGWSQRDLDDWVRQPRSLELSLRVRETSSGTVKDIRDLKLSFPPRLRARDTDTAGARWMLELEQGVRTATQEMLDTLGCEPDVLTVQPATREGLAVSFGDLRLRANQGEFQVVLIPADGQLPAALWPEARVTAAGQATGQLAILNGGDEELCQRQACVAIPR